MDTHAFRLRCERPSGTDDDFMCICPAHDDKNGSLHVTRGQKKILLHCFAGCDQSAILRAMRLTEDDLWLDDARGAGAGGERRAKAEEKKRYPVREMFAVGAMWWNAKAKREEPITAVYDYRDERGEVIVRVARTEIIAGGRREKNFPVHYRDPSDGKWYVGKGPRKDLVYMLPEMLREKAAGETIYIVEGEKDVNNARKLGLCAVCNIGGGGAKNVAGKWPYGCTASIAGAARVVLIPDNDEAGEGLMRYVAHELVGKVGDLRLIRLRDALPTLPAHGDLTDYAKLVGNKSEVLSAIARLVDEAKPLTAEDAAAMQSGGASPAREAQPGGGGKGGDGGDDDDEGEDYYGLKSYCIKYGCLCKRTTGSVRRLCSFVPHPQEVIIRDDGEETHADYVIGATGFDGRELPPVTVRGEDELLGMRWPVKAWQFYGNIYPQNGAEKEVRSAILSAGARAAKRRTVYAHTGWQRMGDGWAYLYNGGAIGAQNVSVELPGPMGRYTLCGAEDAAIRDAAAADIRLIGALPGRIIYPLMAQAYLAPLYSALEAIHDPPIHVIYLVGQSQSYKSTVTGYVVSHFGDFYEQQMPATFQDTANAVRDRAFYAKDALYVVDDYVAKELTNRQRAVMDGIADAMISAIADRAARGRLGPDKQQQAVRPARCTCIMTGEQLPGVSESRKGRMYVINVSRGEIAAKASDLNALQDAREAGLYRAAMRGYVTALRAQYDALPEMLREALRALRDEAARRMTRTEGRWIKMAAHLMLGVTMMLRYYEGVGAIDAQLRGVMTDMAWSAILANIEEQGREQDEASPGQTFIATLRGLIVSGAVQIVDLEHPAPGYYANKAGWMDAEYYYLLPDQTDAAVREILKKQESAMGLNPVQLRKRLRSDGICISDERTGSPLRGKSIDGKTMRLLWIPRRLIDAPSVTVGGMVMTEITEQTEMPQEWMEGDKKA